MDVAVKRVYEPASGEVGTRILVDRLWPRGIAREKASWSHWLRDLAPSDALRRLYGHDPAKWEEFRARYAAELDAVPQAMAELAALARQGRVTLLYSSRERELNNAVALRELLLARAA
ncbi:DUF488 family protein [Chelatococcus sp. SYSU_G07232]|uniref:DUF488 family protein n=1 Tax=Chelatococcus albus TaxID=3047466 RepID=A0ABT7AK32_9HYPH|nr:DUF488 family protein [Chelatococcus sp. SYSU_G07232]MDJ1159722.1 DUF488 family protein [Chelatococcus sp. SYSU_G07232]